MPLVSGFSRDLPFPLPFHYGTAPYSPHSPSSVLKTLLLRATQTSSLALSLTWDPNNAIMGSEPHFPFCFYVINSSPLCTSPTRDLTTAVDAMEIRACSYKMPTILLNRDKLATLKQRPNAKDIILYTSPLKRKTAHWPFYTHLLSYHTIIPS
ncbi:hypothetical protein PR048_028276 [Dryococelus australis]|uniref:Uncharacterized protein n=1 Tax=Dryococelus australis TaxID=614101 RepID=A0ABQ9GIV1_9NEOP|nr:hypothetical protein PR048_028276 [Dryococelus australis]